MRFVAWRGLSEGYRTKLEGHSPWKQGDAGAQPIFVEDIGATDEPAWVKEAIAAEGISGLTFIPLLAQGRLLGKFMSYYPAAHRFTGAEQDFAVTVARQLGFALERCGRLTRVASPSPSSANRRSGSASPLPPAAWARGATT
jgi:GAF domain-containing protein